MVITILDLVAKMGAKTGRCHQSYSNHMGNRCALQFPFARHVFYSFCPTYHPRILGTCYHLKEKGRTPWNVDSPVLVS
jgi:hypothetical protein